MARTKNSAKDDKPAKNLKKVDKPKTRQIDAKIIVETIKELTSELEDGVGASLAAIRNYIANNHGLRMGKSRQMEVKEVMKSEFDAGNIVMSNWDGEKINFKKRFEVMDDDAEEGAEQETSAASANI